ncbi:MAG: class I SAM-dependent RNA methyltransferase [Ilumatobacteraceae bacterium]
MGRLLLRPDRFVAGGDTIARDDGGRVVFVRGALPGETVEAELITEKRDWARATTIAVVEASPDRVTPPCPSRRAGCGGCGWQHLTIDAQRAARVEMVADALRRTGGVRSPVVEHGGVVPPDGYRTTVRVAGDADGRVGFRSESSHEVVPAPECLVAHPVLRALLPELRLDPGIEPTLRVSAATGQLAARWDRAMGEVHGLPEGASIGSSVVLHEDVGGRRLRVSMGSFFQSGPAAAELLVETVQHSAPELADATLVVDAYSGIGMFGACATAPSSRVIAIETSRVALADARHNLSDRPAQVVRGEVGGWHAPDDDRIDVVIADPARSGLGKPGVHSIARTRSPVLVLVSCDAASLARDVKLLAAAGYDHAHSEVVDTFPHTTHIEVVSRFTRRRADR